MSSRQCMYSLDGRIKQFYCAHSQTCCKDECCSSDPSFYTHWYFWLAVAVLIIFLIAAIVSGYCHHRRVPPYRLLSALPGQAQPPLLPWIWSLDEDPSGSAMSSPHDIIQPPHPPSPFIFPSTHCSQQEPLANPQPQQQKQKPQTTQQLHLAVPRLSIKKHEHTCKSGDIV